MLVCIFGGQILSIFGGNIPKLFKNILTVVALAAIVVQAIVLAVQWSEFWWTALLIAVLGAAGVLCMRFAYKIAEWHNRAHSRWHKRNPDMDYTPSRFAVIMQTVSGAVIFVISEAMFIFLFTL